MVYNTESWDINVANQWVDFASPPKKMMWPRREVFLASCACGPHPIVRDAPYEEGRVFEGRPMIP